MNFIVRQLRFESIKYINFIKTLDIQLDILKRRISSLQQSLKFIFIRVHFALRSLEAHTVYLYYQIMMLCNCYNSNGEYCL